MGQHMTSRFSFIRRRWPCGTGALVLTSILLLAFPFCAAHAQLLGYAPPDQGASRQGYVAEQPAPQPDDSQLPDRLRRQLVHFDSREAPGTIVIDTADTYLYYVLGGDRAIRYGA